MPSLPRRPCAYPGCGILLKGDRYCQKHHGKLEQRRQTALNRGRDPEKKKPYNQARWKKFRRMYLRRHPICEWPGCISPSTEVDHITPLEQGGAHCDDANSQALCKPHHSAKTAREVGFVGDHNAE